MDQFNGILTVPWSELAVLYVVSVIQHTVSFTWAGLVKMTYEGRWLFNTGQFGGDWRQRFDFVLVCGKP